MKCIKCNREVKLALQNQKVCNSCFCEIIEKRVRKELRLGKYIRKGDSVLIIDDGSAESRAAIYLLPLLLKDMPFKLLIKKSKYTLGQEFDKSKVIVPWNADKEGKYFLSCVFENKKLKFLGNFRLKGKQYIKLFLPCISEEVRSYANIKKLKFSEVKADKEASFFDNLAKKYPEIKFGFLNASKSFQKKQ
ncbi:MAG: hypothetical protein ABIJ34_06485 [archaeon]